MKLSMQHSKSHNNNAKASAMVIKRNYSGMLNSLQEQIHNARLCHHLAMGESLFVPIPLQKDWHGRGASLMIQCLSHFQPLAHNTILTEPTHRHLFILH